MGLQPVGDQIIIEPVDAEEFTKSGLIIPDVAQEMPMRGTVIAVGSRVQEDVEVGDEIIYNRWGVTELSASILDKKTLILREEHVIAKVAGE